MKVANIIFPHQLFKDSQLIENGHDIFLIEEYLFFKQYNFHKQKIAFHRATMKAYQLYLESRDHIVHYINSGDHGSDIKDFNDLIVQHEIGDLYVLDPCDNWLEQRIGSLSDIVTIHMLPTPLFLNDKPSLLPFFRDGKKTYRQTTFYKQQRKKLNILLDSDGNPEGGKWTYDTDNRKKYPKNKMPPAINFPEKSEFWSEAYEYTLENFSENLGELSEDRLYPVTHGESQEWFEHFLAMRFYDFGIYEDAIVKDSAILNHSVLSPLVNVGLILPEYILSKSVEYAIEKDIPINSTEGFIRQLMGWREFVRGMYVSKGGYSRTRNFWNFDRKIPDSFYDGTTGIEPVDNTIKRVLKTGYCHHIERLMILGNFMLLCEFDPDEVYRWFMELFIDAYDWVMVPNVYGMCTFADGGTFATKPYIGGSNYIKKMSDYSSGKWEDIWDGLFWRFMHTHRVFFNSNPRLSMLVRNFDKMDEKKKQAHLECAEVYLKRLN